MPTQDDTGARPTPRRWHWLLLALMVVPAVWHVLDFEHDADPEFPAVVRSTFNRYPPAAYRLAEPGDTIDRIAIYVSSLALVITLAGLYRGRGERRRWVTASVVSLAAFWYASNPGPTLDGWHGLGWRAAFNPEAPLSLRASLAAAALLLSATFFWGVGLKLSGWKAFRRWTIERDAAALLAVALLFLVVRVAEFPDVEPLGYWPRWAFTWSLVAYCMALLRLLPKRLPTAARWPRFALPVASGAIWYGLVVAGIALSWVHRPLDRLREVVPGKIYMSAMPTARGLELAQSRHHFKTIINLFPEDTRFRSPRLPDELKFAAANGVRYVGSPSGVLRANEFLDQTLALAQDKDAWPILVHCHACMDRTPAWVGIYQFVVANRPLDEIFRFIEGHRGYRPKASVTLLYNRVLPRLAAEKFRNDPTTPLLIQQAEGTTDPYDEQIRIEKGRANQGVATGVGPGVAGGRASLTPRR